MPQMDLTPEEARHIRRRRSSEKRDGYFRQGLQAAVEVVKARISHGAAGPVIEEIMACKRPRKKDVLPT